MKICEIGAVLVGLVWSCVLARDVNGFSPRFAHLSWGNDSNSMVVMWSTHNFTKCVVKYSEADSNWLTSGSKSSNLSENLNAAPFIYRSELQNLAANSQYKYFISCEDTDKTFSNSSIYSFKTADNATDRDVQFIVYGDLGYRAHETFKTLESDVDNNNYDGVFHVGDIAYNLESYGGLTGDKFLASLEKIATRIPYMTSPGNHEIDSDDFTQYRLRFSSPGTEWPIPLDKMWYSYDIGPAHILSYSTEVYFTNDQDHVCKQYYELLDDLLRANQNRDNRPWIIAMGHRPMYCSNKNMDDCSGMIFRGWVKHGLEELFHSMGVDLIIEGHEHSYERLWPTYDGIIFGKNYENPRAPVHIVSGSPGGVHKDQETRDADKWSALRIAKTGLDSYGHLHIVNKTHLFWDQVTTKNLSTLDSMWLVQNRHGPFKGNGKCDSTLSSQPSFCSCPFVFHYETAIQGGIVCASLLALTCIAIVIYKTYRRCKLGQKYKRIRIDGDDDEPMLAGEGIAVGNKARDVCV